MSKSKIARFEFGCRISADPDLKTQNEHRRRVGHPLKSLNPSFHVFPSFIHWENQKSPRSDRFDDWIAEFAFPESPIAVATLHIVPTYYLDAFCEIWTKFLQAFSHNELPIDSDNGCPNSDLGSSNRESDDKSVVDWPTAIIVWNFIEIRQPILSKIKNRQGQIDSTIGSPNLRPQNVQSQLQHYASLLLTI